MHAYPFIRTERTKLEEARHMHVTDVWSNNWADGDEAKNILASVLRSFSACTMPSLGSHALVLDNAPGWWDHMLSELLFNATNVTSAPRNPRRSTVRPKDTTVQASK